MSEKAKAGCDALVYINTGTVDTPIMTVLGEQTDAELKRGTASMDTTSKDDAGWESKRPGFKNWSIDFSAFYTVDDTAYLALERAFENRQILRVQSLFPDGTAWSGDAMISSAPISMKLKDAIVVQFTMDGAGALTNNLLGTITTPSITTPANAATGIVDTANMVGSAFASSNTDTHTGSEWQVTLATDPTFASPVIDTLSNVMKITLHVGAGEMTTGTQYIARVRYNGKKNGWSAWSATNGFTTA